LAEREDIRRSSRRWCMASLCLVGVETFNKPARIGSGVPYHQDNAYFCQSPPDMLTVWIAIDAVTEANGPVFFVKGSHRPACPHETQRRARQQHRPGTALIGAA
jgi:phytanoyl-CoA hydroxylase